MSAKRPGPARSGPSVRTRLRRRAGHGRSSSRTLTKVAKAKAHHEEEARDCDKSAMRATTICSPAVCRLQ